MKMKKIVTRTGMAAALCAAWALAACEKDLEPFSSTDCHLNFVYTDMYGTVAGEDVTDEMRTSTYSFVSASAGTGTEVVRDTLWFEASTMGFLSDVDRTIPLVQVETEGRNARPGVDYVPFDDPGFLQLCKVPANTASVQVPIIVLRSPSLETEGDVTLKFAFGTNEYFSPGYKGLTERVLVISGRLARPNNWEDAYWGTYSQAKHELMIEWTGDAWDETFLEELYDGDYAYVDYIARWFYETLAEVNADRAAQDPPLEPLTDENGEEIQFVKR